MFVGHYGVAFAAKRVAPAVPLWITFVAVQWLDVVWSLLVLMGIERLRIVPGITEANALDLYYMPYTHSLPGAFALSLLLGGVAAITIAERRGTTFLVVSAAAFSHWLLDLIVHIPDLPLYDNADKVGFGLWRHVGLSFPLELILLIGGAWIYTRVVRPVSLRGHNAMRGFVALLVLMQVYANFGPPPASENAMAIMALGFYAILAAIAAWVEATRGRA